MPRTKASNEAQYRYNAKHLKRVPLDLPLDFYAALKSAAESCGSSVNGYIKDALREKIEREEQEGGTSHLQGENTV